MTHQIQEPYREVAAAIVIGSCGRLLFQRRDDIPGLMYPGMIGLFGGHREGNETGIECLQREILEETGQIVATDRCQPFVEFSARYPLGGGVKGEFFILHGLVAQELVVTEGALLAVSPERVPALLPEMTPTTCYVARLYMELHAPLRH